MQSMSESSKVPRPSAVPSQNPLLSASVTGIAFDDFPNKPLLLPAAPPIVHTPAPMLAPILLGREQKSLVTVGSTLNNNNDEDLDEINLNASNDDNDNNFQIGSDSILSQAASSFSALPSVASNVFATFSKRITGSTSRDSTPINDNSISITNTTPTVQQLDIQPLYIQQQQQQQQQNCPVYTNTSDTLNNNYHQSNTNNRYSIDNNRNIDSAPAIEPPKFYNPNEVTTFSVPPPPSSTSSGQNNFRFTAKKKVYAPIPGLTDSNQQFGFGFEKPPATNPFDAPLFHTIESSLSSATVNPEERKSNNGILSNITNLVPSGVLQNISEIVHSAAQSIKPGPDTYPNRSTPINTVPITTIQVIEPNKDNTSLISPSLNYFELSVNPQSSILNLVESTEQQKAASIACSTDNTPHQTDNQKTSNITSAVNKEHLLSSVNINYFNPERQVTPDRPARPPSRKSLTQPSLELEPSGTPQCSSPTFNTIVSQQPTLIENTIPLVKPPTDSQLESTTAGRNSSFRLQKGTRFYKNPFIGKEPPIPISQQLIVEPIATPSLNVTCNFTPSQQAAYESQHETIFPHSPAIIFNDTLTANANNNLNTSPQTDNIISSSLTDNATSSINTQQFFQPSIDCTKQLDANCTTNTTIDKSLETALTVTQPPLTTEFSKNDILSKNPYRRYSNTAESSKPSQLILANFFTPTCEDPNSCNFFTNLATEYVQTSCNTNINNLQLNSQNNSENVENKANNLQNFFCDSFTNTSSNILPDDLNIASSTALTNIENRIQNDSEPIQLEGNIPPPRGFEDLKSHSAADITNFENLNDKKLNLNVLNVDKSNSIDEQQINNITLNQELPNLTKISNSESDTLPSLIQIDSTKNRLCSQVELSSKQEEENILEMSGSWLSDKMTAASSSTNIVYKPAVMHWFYKRIVGTKEIWTPFSHYDSALIETSILSRDETIVPVEGGRYDVNIQERKKVSVYWESEPIEVRRCSWFYKTVDSKYIPYEEKIADVLEFEYKQASESGNWHKTVLLDSGEQVVFHGPTLIVHFQQQQNTDAWGGTSQGNSRPRVVKRDLDDFHIEQGESQNVDHLLFMVHGIGSVCDLKLRSVEEVVDDFRSIAGQLVQSHYKNSFDTGLVGRVEILPISWHNDLHSAEIGIDEKLKSITLESIPKLRNFTNDTLLDILFYTSPTYCQRIMNTVANAMNTAYTKYRQRNPDFKGGVSLAGHSLGSLILFDLLCHQKPIKECEEIDLENSQNDLKPSEDSTSSRVPTLGPRQISYTMGTAGTGQPFIHYEQLLFQPKKFFALGSPIGMFVTIRGIDKLGLDFCLPTCTGFYNIFHPYDPVAYRIEALINPDLSSIRPVLIAHHKGRKRMHLELKETMARVSTDLKQKFFDKFKSTLETVDIFGLTNKSRNEAEELMEKEVEKVIEMQKQLEEHGEKSGAETPNNVEEKVSRVRADSVSTVISDDMVELDFPLGKLNDSKRVDYVLQEAPLEFFNEYIFALTSHVCYWDSEDTILFVMKEIYTGLGITPDSQVPQQTMTIERTSSRNSTPSMSSVASPIASAPPT